MYLPAPIVQLTKYISPLMPPLGANWRQGVFVPIRELSTFVGGRTNVRVG